MRESSKAALGGIISALAVVVMLVTYLSPFLVYTAPAFAGILLLVIVNELGYRWAFGTYVSISILSVFFIADKEAAVYFTMFFGYYPILKLLLEQRLHKKPVRALLKFLIFNASIAASIAVCIFVFHIPFDVFSKGGYIVTVVFWVLLNFFLLVHDYFVAGVQRLYQTKLKAQIHKIFRH